MPISPETKAILDEIEDLEWTIAVAQSEIAHLNTKLEELESEPTS